MTAHCIGNVLFGPCCYAWHRRRGGAGGGGGGGGDGRRAGVGRRTGLLRTGAEEEGEDGEDDDEGREGGDERGTGALLGRGARQVSCGQMYPYCIV